MNYSLYSIKDNKVGFLSLMQDVNDATAMRNFAFAINSSTGMYSYAPGDFSLYRFGTFDTETGKFDILPVPELIVDGYSLVDSSLPCKE